jgi:hypothetical protein
MGKDNNRLLERLSAIKSAKPFDAPTPAPPARAKGDPRRKEARAQTYRFARLVVGRQTVLKCILRDISPSGARIAMEGAFELPPEVILAIDQSGLRYRARVAWRSENEAGLSLLGEIAVKQTSGPTKIPQQAEKTPSH